MKVFECPGVMGAVKRNTNSAVKQIAAGVGGGVVGLLAIVAVSAESGCVALYEEKKVKI